MELINTEKERGLELWPVGFPGGSYISPTAAMGIHAATEEPEAAWSSSAGASRSGKTSCSP